MRFFLLSLLLLPLAKPAAEVAVFNEANERRVMVITGAGGEEDYTGLFAKCAADLAKEFDGNRAELVRISNQPENTDARQILVLHQ